MSRENSRSVPTGGNSCLPNTPEILNSRASTSSLSSVALPGADFRYHQHQPLPSSHHCGRSRGVGVQ
jgi:hypothetical protein